MAKNVTWLTTPQAVKEELQKLRLEFAPCTKIPMWSVERKNLQPDQAPSRRGLGQPDPKS